MGLWLGAWGLSWIVGELQIGAPGVMEWKGWKVGGGEVGGGSGDLRRESLGVWVEHLGLKIGATVRLQLGCLGVVSSLFIGEFKTSGLGLKYRKGKVESFKRSVILVAQGFLKRGTSCADGLALHLAVSLAMCLLEMNVFEVDGLVIKSVPAPCYHPDTVQKGLRVWSKYLSGNYIQG